jgi:hypothetical protein
MARMQQGQAPRDPGHGGMISDDGAARPSALQALYLVSGFPRV